MCRSVLANHPKEELCWLQNVTLALVSSKSWIWIFAFDYFFHSVAVNSQSVNPNRASDRWPCFHLSIASEEKVSTIAVPEISCAHYLNECNSSVLKRNKKILGYLFYVREYAWPTFFLYRPFFKSLFAATKTSKNRLYVNIYWRTVAVFTFDALSTSCNQ